MDENIISEIIVNAAIEVHRTLGGPGLLESVYRDALALEIGSRDMEVEREKPVPVKYKGQVLSTPLRLDLLVGGLVIVECKATIAYNPIFESQVLTYLRLTGLKAGAGRQLWPEACQAWDTSRRQWALKQISFASPRLTCTAPNAAQVHVLR